MTFRNIYLGLKDQMPLSRLLRNLWKGDLLGLFHRRSHFTHGGTPKNSFPTKESATRAAERMTVKHGVYFSNYKCMRCDGYHLGKTRSARAGLGYEPLRK